MAAHGKEEHMLLGTLWLCNVCKTVTGDARLLRKLKWAKNGEAGKNSQLRLWQSGQVLTYVMHITFQYF